MPDPKQKILLSDSEIEQAGKLSGLGLTSRQIADFIGISKKTFERRMKDQPELLDAIEKGRSKAAAAVMKTAFELATSGSHPTFTMFWLKCRAGWSETDAEDEKQGEYKPPKSLRLA